MEKSGIIINGDIMITFLNIFIKFIIYSFIGYVAECIFVSFENKKPTNRGFLCGPVCPIYGVGGLLMAFFLKNYKGDYIALFVLGAILATVIEYITGWALEKLFHNKWWDYSKNKFNINGRVCLLNTVLFGIGAIAVVMFGEPVLDKLLAPLSNFWIILLGIVLLILFVLDMIYSWIVAFNLRNNIIIVEDLKNKKLSDLPEMLEETLKSKINRIKKIPKRVSKAFPKFIGNYKAEFDIINNLKMSSKKKKTKKSKKKEK